MGLYSELPVYKACYNLLLETYMFTRNFTKEYKYTIGETLKKETVNLLIFTWNHSNMVRGNEIRKRYIMVIREGDKGNIEPLVEFARN